MSDERYVRANMELLQRMLDAGLSRFEPDPLQELERVGRAKMRLIT